LYSQTGVAIAVVVYFIADLVRQWGDTGIVVIAVAADGAQTKIGGTAGDDVVVVSEAVSIQVLIEIDIQVLIGFAIAIVVQSIAKFICSWEAGLVSSQSEPLATNPSGASQASMVMSSFPKPSLSESA
jgi:hypothetical protein